LSSEGEKEKVREIIIIVSVIILVTVSSILLQNYLKKTSSELTKLLEELESSIKERRYRNSKKCFKNNFRKMERNKKILDTYDKS